ncbi:MAG: class I SAM-dependent methyltransferase [Planctomycetota bacterium]|jgi:2-polyprenyl-3-methyl-5-hydroxy-6-metoxy-1,4-benzoquinol methylase
MCTACNTLNTAASEAFAGRMIEIANHGALALMISVGHRTRIFDTLTDLGDASPADLAERAGLNERYVREWLGAMVTGGILDHDPAAGTYSLPPERAAWLTRSASPDNLAVTTQFIPLLGSVEDDIVECFQRGGGVPYTRFRRFHEVMAEESNQTVVAGLEEHILPLIEGMIDRLEEGIDVLDVGCGSGRAMNWLARRFPNSRFRGYDFSEEAVANARREARLHTTPNVEFHVRDAAALQDVERYDLITAFDAIHDQARPAAVLAGIQRALKPGGIFLMQDIKAQTPHAAPREHRQPARAAALHGELHALHDRLARLRRRRPRRHVGPPAGGVDARRRGLR